MAIKRMGLECGMHNTSGFGLGDFAGHVGRSIDGFGRVHGGICISRIN